LRFGVFLLRTLAGFCPVAAVDFFSAFSFDFWAFLLIAGAVFTGASSAGAAVVGEPGFGL
jgi:hypothetical protein